MKPTHATTLLAALGVLSLAAPAAAWPFGGAPAAKPAPASATAAAKPSDTPVPKAEVKASPEERAKAARLDPLTRVAFWTREVNADPGDVEAAVALASTLRALGRFTEAADTADHALTMHPGSLPAMLELARARVSDNKGFYAIKTLLAASAQAPRDVRPWVLLGVAYEQNEQPDLAEAAYRQALVLAPNDPAALSNYALFRATHGEPQAAEALLRRAVAQPGAGPAERQNLALVLGLQGKMGEAERLIRQDLPPETADADLAYLRSLSPAAHPAGVAAAQRSWTAVEASETAQIKTPTR